MSYAVKKLLSEKINQDSIYQELLKSCLLLEPEYIRIRDALPETDRKLLERYISLCEELDHRRLTLALTI